MTPQELRIGNIVMYANLAYELPVVGIYEHGIYVNDINGEAFYINKSQIVPIPLTEEWLLKFGFEKDDDSLIRLDLIEIFFSDNKPYVWIYPTTPKKMKHIKYVHQLQNLYFALTGEELNFKE